MIAETFRTAMFNALRIGPYDTPYQSNPPVQEWLIAARSGPGGVYLIISDTAIPVEGDAISAPDDLSEQNSIVAILAEDRADAPQFLMLRHLPEGLSVPGRFFPADGMAQLRKDGTRLCLSAFGRHAHSRGSVDGQTVLHDIPHPAPNAEGALNGHFAAEGRPWVRAG
jgi:hypothetical protein